MSSTVKKLLVTYNAINAQNTFTNGDVICGHVTLEVAKDCQMDYLYIKFKGKAEVIWTERHGKTTHVYHSKDKYFSVRQYFIRDKKTKDDKLNLLTNQHSETYSSVVAPGIHVYPFSFQFPPQNIPSSFKGADGKVVYLLEARLSRSMRLDKTESTLVNFVAKPDLGPLSGLMTPQHESKDKKMKVFTSGAVAMDVNLEKSGFFQGEGLKVLLFAKNNSSREIKPKYCIYRKHSFFAQGKRRVHTKDLIKEVGAPIPPSASEKITKILNIPHDMEPSILNCNIIKSEYRLRVYLDVKYASDPEIKFDIVILPGSQVPAEATASPGAPAFGPYPNPGAPPGAPAFGPYPNSGAPPGAPAFGPYPNPGAPPGAPAFGPYPNPGAPPVASGYGPFGSPNPPVWGFTPPPTAPTAPTAPPAPSGASQPSDFPPPYGAHELYPPLNNFENKH